MCTEQYVRKLQKGKRNHSYCPHSVTKSGLFLRLAKIDISCFYNYTVPLKRKRNAESSILRSSN